MEQKKKHSHKGHRQRMKEKALNGGITHWQYHEILELILMYSIPQKDVNPLAHELIEKFSTLGGVLDAGYDQLSKINGVGKETALFLTLLPEIFSKYTASKNIDAVVLDTTDKCVNHFKTVGRVRKIEDLYVFCLDNKKRLIKTVHIDSGLASAVNFSITDLAEQIAIKNNKSVVIMHSHPGGNSNPTQSDAIATKRLMSMCATLGIKVDDHIIVADNEYFSFYHSGLYETILNDIKRKI